MFDFITSSTARRQNQRMENREPHTRARLMPLHASRPSSGTEMELGGVVEGIITSQLQVKGRSRVFE